MFSLNNSHGAFQPFGKREPAWQFSGEHGPQEVSKMKEIITNDLRILSLDRFLTEPIEALTPDPKLYDHTSLTDQRKFKLDCEEVLKQATQAWSIIRQRFRQGSAAESLIKSCDEEGAADKLWTTFTNHYCNRTTRAGIMQIVERFFDDKVAINPDILSYFTLYNDIFREIQSVPLLQHSANSLTGLSSPLRQRLPATPQLLASRVADGITNEASASLRDRIMGPTSRPEILSVSTFPQWAQVLFILFRIAQFPKHQKFIKDFLFEYVTKAIERNIETMTTDECFNLLKAYTKIWPENNGEAPINILQHYTEKAGLYCAFHGENSSHETRHCKKIHMATSGNEREPREHFSSYTKHPNYRQDPREDNRYHIRDSYRGRSQEEDSPRRQSNRNSYSRSRSRSNPRDRSAERYSGSPSPYVIQHNTETNMRSAAKNPSWYSGTHGYSSSELSPGYRSTPPRSDYDSNTEEDFDNDNNLAKEFRY